MEKVRPCSIYHFSWPFQAQTSQLAPSPISQDKKPEIQRGWLWYVLNIIFYTHLFCHDCTVDGLLSHTAWISNTFRFLRGTFCTLFCKIFFLILRQILEHYFSTDKLSCQSTQLHWQPVCLVSTQRTFTRLKIRWWLYLKIAVVSSPHRTLPRPRSSWWPSWSCGREAKP